MAAIITNDIRVHNAKQFKEAFSEPANTTIYTFIGQPIAANASASPDTVQIKYDVWDNMIALKRVQDGDITHVIPRYDWESGQTYVRYDHAITNLVDTEFFVMNSNFEVFKCLANANGSPSTVAPSAADSKTTGNTSLLSDGYKWKYMYTITASEAAKFVTTGFIPVKEDSTVKSQAVDGGILQIEVLNPGSGYTTATLSIIGDGSGANATVNLSSGAVSNVTIVNPGTGYRFANVSISGDGSGASLRPIISPAGGHGSDPISELGGKYLMVNTRLEPTDTKFPLNIDYYQIGLVQEPTLYGTSNVVYDATYRAHKIITLDSIATANFGDIITGTTTGANAFVLKSEGSNIYYVQTEEVSANLASNFKQFTTADSITGIGNVIAVVQSEVQPDSGKVLYIDNRNVISRVSDQVESVHIVLEF